MEPVPDNFPLVKIPADTLFGGQTWGWACIDCRAMLAQNQNEPPFKNGWIPQSLSYIDIFLHCLPFKWLRIILLQSTSRSMKEADIDPLTYGDLLRHLGLWFLMSTCSGWKKGGFCSVTPFYQEGNPCPYCLEEFISKCRFHVITHKLRVHEPKFMSASRVTV